MMMIPILEEFAQSHPKVFVGKIDTIDQQRIFKQFNVNVYPQIILFQNGQELKRNIGPLSVNELENFVADATAKNCG